MKKRILIIMCCVFLISGSGGFLWIAMEKQTKQGYPSPHSVEFTEPPSTVMGFEQRYNGSEIYLGDLVNASQNKWESYLNVYKATYFVSINTTTALKEAKKYGVTGNNVTLQYANWIVVSGPEGTVKFAIPTTDTNADAMTPFAVSVECGSDSHFPGHDFISDEEAVSIAWNFVNMTVLNTVPHLREHLSLKLEIVGSNNVTGGPYPTYTVSKVVAFALYYGNYWIGDLINVWINHTGGVFSYTAPTDFVLTPESQVYSGTPQELLNYYKTHGINIGKDINASEVTKVVIEKIEVSYKPDTENQSLKNPFERYVPYYYLKYTIHGRNGFSKVFYGSLYIKNSS
ncbi:MAG: hypothetical protein QW620_02270 [Thermoplasmata archaeon]